MSDTLPVGLFAEWLLVGERGVSSEAIVSHLTGIPIRQWSGSDHPYDPADFRRCELLLRAVPLARSFLPRMAEKSGPWERLVARWDDIVATIEEEAPGAFERQTRNQAAPKAHALMRSALEGQGVSS